MKRILSLILFAALLSGCGKYDDTELRGVIDAQDARITALAAQIAELQQIVDALSAGDFVTGVEPIKEGETTVGITVLFHASANVVILFASSGSGSGISGATVTGGELLLSLVSGATVRLAITPVPELALDKASVLLFPGGNTTVAYTITGGDAGNSVQALVEGLWSAEVVPTDATAGTVSLTAPDPCTDAKVVLMVTSGAGKSSFRTIACTEAHFSVAKASYQAAAEAGQFAVSVNNNLGAFTVEIPQEAAAWLAAPAVSETEVTFALTENTGEERSATVKLKNAAYDAEVSFQVVQADGGTFVWKPVTTAAGVVAGDCVLAYLRQGDSKLLFLSGATALNRNPAAVEAAAAGVTFTGDDITAVDAAYIWKAAASGTNWTFAGSDGLWLIGADKYQGAAVLADLKGYYHSTSSYARTWSFTDDADYGLQMLVTESASRHLSVADEATVWSMMPELKGHIVLYYKTRL